MVNLDLYLGIHSGISRIELNLVLIDLKPACITPDDKQVLYMYKKM